MIPTISADDNQSVFITERPITAKQALAYECGAMRSFIMGLQLPQWVINIMSMRMARKVKRKHAAYMRTLNIAKQLQSK